MRFLGLDIGFHWEVGEDKSRPLIPIHRVDLDESRFGKGDAPGRWFERRQAWAYYRVAGEREDYHCTQEGISPIMVAVTPGQQKAWKAGVMLCRPVVKRFTFHIRRA